MQKNGEEVLTRDKRKNTKLHLFTEGVVKISEANFLEMVRDIVFVIRDFCSKFSKEHFRLYAKDFKNARKKL